MSELHDTPQTSGRVVVVEDDPLQAESLAFILRQEGYVVELASTGAEALTIARGQPAPDTVLLDVALPDLSGIEVARRLRAGSNVPIIMLTARRNEIDKITGLDAGADDYVTKPFSHGELLARIRAQIRRGPSGARQFHYRRVAHRHGDAAADARPARDRCLSARVRHPAHPRRSGRPRRRAAAVVRQRVGASVLWRRARPRRVRPHD